MTSILAQCYSEGKTVSSRTKTYGPSYLLSAILRCQDVKRGKRSSGLLGEFTGRSYDSESSGDP